MYTVVRYYLPAIFALGLLVNTYVIRAEDDDKDKPKHDIKEIMVLAHKKGLYKKVIEGKASDDEKKQLTVLYIELSQNHPSKGSDESWKEKTTAVVKASKDVEAGKEGATAALKKANNCASCHKAHK